MTETQPTGAAGAAALDLVAALDRLLTIGSLYPRGHARCKQIGKEFRSEFDRVLGGRSTLSVHVLPDTLAVQSEPVDVKVPHVGRVHRALAALGVLRLELDSTATIEDFLDLAAELLRCRHLVETSNRLQPLDLPAFSSSVRVRQREFGARVQSDPAASSDAVAAAVARVVERLNSSGIPGKPAEMLRSLVERVLQGVARRIDLTQSGADSPAEFTRSLEQVLDLGVHAIEQAVPELVSASGEAHRVRKLFDCAEKALALSPDRKSVQIMLDVLRQIAKETEVDRASAAASADHVMSVEELCQALDDYAKFNRRESHGDATEQQEFLSVVLQILCHNPERRLVQTAIERLSNLLSGRLRASDEPLLVAAVRDLLAQSDQDLADRLLPAIVRSVRSSGAILPARFLVEVGRGLPDAILETLWPHVVNEAMRGVPEAIARDLHRLAAGVRPAAMRRRLPRLDELDACRSREFDRTIFQPPVSELFPVFEQLLDSSARDVVAPLLWKGFRRAAFEWPGCQVFAMFPEYTPALRPFLAKMLHSGSDGRPTDAVMTDAVRILRESLPKLPGKRRGEAWVRSAIDSVVALDPIAGRPLLQDILRARRFLLVPGWPPECRDAARAGLEHAAAHDGSVTIRNGSEQHT
jgi:hypothetical protein